MMELFRRLVFLPAGASDAADRIDALHAFVITVTMLGSAAVGIAALAFVARYRRRGRPGTTERVSATLGLESVWIGGLLALFLAWWVIGFSQYLTLRAPPKSSLDVYVTAKQWMWKFAEPTGRSSVGVLVVPRGRPVRLILTSRDVIHSFFVPDFRIKQDAVPGRYTTAWFRATRTGTYPVYCAEFCGTSHSRMWASVVVIEPEDYERWLEGEEPAPVLLASANARRSGGRIAREAAGSLAERGRRIAVRHACTSCHTVDGQPHIGPSWRGLFGSEVELERGDGVIADEAYLTESMMDPKAKVVRGYQPLMPTYRGLLQAGEAAALVEYIKSLSRSEAAVVDLPAVRALPDAGSREISR